MFLYDKTNILEGSGIFEVDFAPSHGPAILVAPGGAVTPHPGAPRVLARPDPGPPSGEAREEVIGGPVGDGHQLAAVRPARPVS